MKEQQQQAQPNPGSRGSQAQQQQDQVRVSQCLPSHGWGVFGGRKKSELGMGLERYQGDPMGHLPPPWQEKYLGGTWGESGMGVRWLW